MNAITLSTALVMATVVVATRNKRAREESERGRVQAEHDARMSVLRMYVH